MTYSLLQCLTVPSIVPITVFDSAKYCAGFWCWIFKHFRSLQQRLQWINVDWHINYTDAWSLHAVCSASRYSYNKRIQYEDLYHLQSFPNWKPFFTSVLSYLAYPIVHIYAHSPYIEPPTSHSLKYLTDLSTILLLLCGIVFHPQLIYVDRHIISLLPN